MKPVRPLLSIAGPALLTLVLCAPIARAAPSQSPAEFFKALMVAQGRGQYDREYDWLDPAQARYVNKTKFVGCMQDQKLLSYSVVGFKVLDQYATTLRIPGTGVRARMLALTLRVKFRADEDGSRQSFTQTVHTRNVAHHWRWMLGLSEVQAYRAGKCPPA